LDRRIDSKRIFLFRGRDVAVTMNSVKILHAVRSAITAIAELLVAIALITIVLYINTYITAWLSSCNIFFPVFSNQYIFSTDIKKTFFMFFKF